MAPALIRDAAGIAALVATSPGLLRQMRAVAALRLPDCWVAAGRVRNAVWDALSGFPPGRNPPGDVDVVWFDPRCADPAEDAAAEHALRAAYPGVPWSVRNQARMHGRNGHAPYAGTLDAMLHWPETATAVGVRLGPAGVEVAAPHGLADLFGLVVRPAPAAAPLGVGAAFEARLAAKGWTLRWPGLRIVRSAASGVSGQG